LKLKHLNNAKLPHYRHRVVLTRPPKREKIAKGGKRRRRDGKKEVREGWRKGKMEESVRVVGKNEKGGQIRGWNE